MSALRQVAEYLIDTLDLPKTLRQSLKQNITKNKITLPEYTLHVCNDVMKDFLPKWEIGYSYEDHNLYGRYGVTQAEEKWEQIRTIAPGRYVHITTGDLISAADSLPDSDTYDPHYYHYIVEAAVWRFKRKTVMALDAQWRLDCQAKLYQRKLPI